jgi:catechol 2,3-dioxygenase-like lactoylglutathione lyase family enzyme
MSNAIPVLRVYDYTKTIEFYIDWLGAKIVWEHTEANTPFYMQISLCGATINLSQHHGDCSPGALTLLEGCENLKSYQQQLLTKEYTFMKPGLEKVDWDPKTIKMTVIDPFYNRLIFTEKGG